MSKAVKPNSADPIEVPTARQNMLSIVVRFVVTLTVIITVLALAWSR